MFLKIRSVSFVAALAAGVLASQVVSAADSPKVSTFAPAKDLANQADAYIKSLQDCVADEAEYKDSTGKIACESNTLVVIALALGLHDQDNKYKASAGAVLKAAQGVAATKDFASAKKAIAALAELKSGEGKSDAALKWEKVASLPELMKQVPTVNTKLTMGLAPASFKKKAKGTAGYSAVLATIANASIFDTSATKDAAQVKQWETFSAAMRDNAGALNAAIHNANQPAAADSLQKLTKSCEDCHAVFKPEVKK
jgi:hypothetical protein